MLKSDVLNAFKSDSPHDVNIHARIAEAIGVTRSAVYQWGDIVPYASACKLEKLPLRKLKVDESLYKSNRPVQQVA